MKSHLLLKTFLLAALLLGSTGAATLCAQENVKREIESLVKNKKLGILLREIQDKNPETGKLVTHNSEYYLLLDAEHRSIIDNLLNAFERDKDKGYSYSCNTTLERWRSGSDEPSTYQWEGSSIQNINAGGDSYYVFLNVLDPKDHRYRNSYIMTWKYLRYKKDGRNLEVQIHVLYGLLPMVDRLSDFDARENKTYQIVNKGNNMLLDINQRSENTACIWSISDIRPTQLWYLKRVGDYYQIVSKSNGRALYDSRTTVMNDNTPLRLVSPNANDRRQLWSIVSQGDEGYYNIINAGSHYTMNMASGMNYDGAAVISYETTNRNATSSNRLWRFEMVK